jgi:hypothetical protein
MKKASLGDYLLWRGEPAKIIATTSREQVVIELLKNATCPHCNGDLGKDQTHVIVSSPLFQENAQEMKSIKEV